MSGIEPSAPAPEPEYSVLAAQVAGAHGVTGNVRLRLIGSNPALTAQSLQSCRRIRATSPGGGHFRDLTLASLRKQPQPKGAWIARFKEITDRTAAESLYGYGLSIPEAARTALPPGEFYVDQLLGTQVLTDRGRKLGRLADILNTPAHDVYVTDQDVMIPAVAEYILRIDLDQGIILVRDVPGLGDGA